MTIRIERWVVCDECGGRDRFTATSERAKAGWVEKRERGGSVMRHQCPECAEVSE